MKEAFFYGLYMDSELLKSLGVTPKKARIAYVDRSQLDLHGAVKILPLPGHQVWGMIFQMTAEELQRLYSRPAAKSYQAETMEAITQEGDKVAVICYNLPLGKSAPLNVEYLDKLLPLAKRLGLPAYYLAQLEGLSI